MQDRFLLLVEQVIEQNVDDVLAEGTRARAVGLRGWQGTKREQAEERRREAIADRWLGPKALESVVRAYVLWSTRGKMAPELSELSDSGLQKIVDFDERRRRKTT